MHGKLIHLVPGRKSGIIHESFHSNAVFHIRLIVDCKLQSQYTPNRSHNHIFVTRSLHEQYKSAERKQI